MEGRLGGDLKAGPNVVGRMGLRGSALLNGSVETLLGAMVVGSSPTVCLLRGCNLPLVMLLIGGRGVLIPSGPIGATGRVGEKGGDSTLALPSWPLTSSSEEA